MSTTGNAVGAEECCRQCDAECIKVLLQLTNAGRTNDAARHKPTGPEEHTRARARGGGGGTAVL